VTAPSVLHEERVRTLRTVGNLAGFPLTSRLTDDDWPDVFLVDLPHLRVFVGDAKVTESPGTYATKLRLASYFRASIRWHHLGFQIAVILCVRSGDAGRWLQLLLSTAVVVGLRAGQSSVVDLDDGESLVSVTVET